MIVKSSLKLFWLTTAGAVAGAYGCSDGPGDAPGEQGPPPDDSVKALIGGVRVSSHSLDAVGALGFNYDYGTGGAGGTGAVDGGPGAGGAWDAGSPMRPASIVPDGGGGCYPYGCYPSNFNALCTGTLIGPTAVLTSRSCASYSGGYYSYPGSVPRFVFAVGADSSASERHVEVVHVSYPSSGDLAVVHLAEPVTGVTPFPLSNLNANHVGQKFAALGYGAQATYGTRGVRRAGAVTLRGIEGRVYEFAFGSFEEFFAYHAPYPWPSYDGGHPGDGGRQPRFDSGPHPDFDGGSPDFDGGADPQPSFDGGSPDFDGGSPDFDGGYPESDAGDWYREQLLAQYNDTLLGADEAYAGGAEGDAQPCHGDDGGPLARSVNGQVRVFGVMSRLPAYECERGALYTRFTPELRQFITEALRWRDPCDGATRLGHCEGTVAVRCTNPEEGERRAVRFDCSLLAQTCVSPPGSEVTCSD
ncbi:MAG TPA: trypsin-like serine protease [Polyangiaceae bacterium]